MIHTKDRIIKHKNGMLKLAEDLGKITKTCKMCDVSRDTFYRYKEAVLSGGEGVFFEKDWRVPNHKSS
ncbi:helix-turn-helix domain-containing protein [Microbulbifer sp. DLAB2-AA]|uniref:helix-turn-helix domain-containing protein n=1 Tax=Microbulbifer sp. DLAB2-AA TaxID=3243394 RepID=UPI004039BAEE